MEQGGQHETEASLTRTGDPKARRRREMLNRGDDIAEVCPQFEI